MECSYTLNQVHVKSVDSNWPPEGFFSEWCAAPTAAVATVGGHNDRGHNRKFTQGQKRKAQQLGYFLA